ncbi:platelet glycoprotein Ib alpha chain-like [Pseudophryne corroboree]|uniref:platelet glycoprotein Ib alpha chain-like n=1 Tax=Pseudophryne corroboree TaxID=495146 RepID=UPI0030820A8F
MGNKLTEIPDGFFDGLDNLAYVYLEKNPWNCNCALEYFKKWIEENDFSVYQLSDGHPVNDAESVICFDGTPLLHYSMDQCHFKGKGDMDFKFLPKPPTKALPTVKATKAEPVVRTSTQPWPTILIATSEVGKMAETTTVLTTKVWQTSTDMKFGEITTPTTKPATTKVYASTWTSGASRTSERTTEIPNTTTYQTLLMTTSDVGTTGITTEVPIPSLHSTTKRELSTVMTTATSDVPTSVARSSKVPTPTLHSTTKREPSTVMTAATSDATTSVAKTPVTMTSGDLRGTQEQLLYSMPPARDSRVAATGMSWLAQVILEHCCILHLLIYALCLLIVLAQMVTSVLILVWTYHFFYSHYKALTEDLPEIRLVRYSLRAPADEGEILLMHNGTLESHFRDQSSNGVTRMLVIEADARAHDIRCTSAIL